MAAPVLRAIFFQSTYPGPALAAVVAQCTEAIRRDPDGLEPVVKYGHDAVTVSARPKRRTATAEPGPEVQ